ncbi:MAG: 3-octaprenyl-4-hydroxybenzoate carboxy-lyase [Chloroflexi bacterium]|nr:3-octaprenyl-4-hydroxybenzoate carboxy-lyase [Chloroflexota bacterium]
MSRRGSRTGLATIRPFTLGQASSCGTRRATGTPLAASSANRFGWCLPRHWAMERRAEGPFGEFTRYFGGQSLNPYLKVTAITHRRDPYWFSLVCGSDDEGFGLGALRREGAVFETLSRVVPQVTNVYRPASSPNHMYVQMRKTHDAQPRAAILATLAASTGSVNHVFIFDEDVDIFDEHEVMWAIGSRSDWAKDLIIIPDAPLTGLHPLCTGPGIGTVAGLDCTMPAPPATYQQRSFIPAEIMAEMDLDDYVRRPSPTLQTV